MNSEIIKEWLNNICSRTGVSVSGDRTLRNDEVEKIVEYVENLEQALDEIEGYLNANEYEYVYQDCKLIETQMYTDLKEIIKKAKGEMLAEIIYKDDYEEMFENNEEVD